MKKILTLAIAALTLGLTAMPEGRTASTARVAWVYNQVQITRGGRWVSAGNGATVASGAYVRTGTNSRAQIHYADGSVMRMGSRSVARVREARAKNVQLHRGKAYFKVSPQQQKMKVRTRSAVATVLGTEFVVEIKEGNDLSGQLFPQAPGLGSDGLQLAQGDTSITRITTLDGLVGVSDVNGNNELMLPEGSTTYVSFGAAPAPAQEIDLEDFEGEQEDLGLDDDNDLATAELDPNNPVANTQIQFNSPGANGTLNTSPTTGNLELIIK